jgi:Peptidogalycan biosysnthesis/recognition
MTLQVEAHPLDQINSVSEWDHTVEAAGAPVFYSSRFLNSVATAPLLSANLASLLLLHNKSSIMAGVPIFHQNCVDPLNLLAPLRSEMPGLSSGSGLIGHCWHCYDTRIVSGGCRAGQSQLLVDSLRALARKVRADYFGLVNVSDPYTLEVMASAGVTPRYMIDRYVMDITGYSSFEDYVAALHPDSRRELRRQFRRYQESGAEIAVEVPPVRDLEEVVLLCLRTAARHGAEFYYPEEETKFLLASLDKTLRLFSVRYGGERIGVLVCFLDPPRLHVWAAGMCYNRTAFSPYAITMAEAIRFAIVHKISIVEGGRGNGRVKLKQGFVSLRLYACLHRP